jgi:hypothetical protein
VLKPILTFFNPGKKERKKQILKKDEKLNFPALFSLPLPAVPPGLKPLTLGC